MNSKAKRLKAFFARKRMIKNLVLSVVILIEVAAILVVASTAWVETVSSIKIKTKDNDLLEIDTYYRTEATLDDSQNTVDLGNYFKQSGDMHFAPCSSVDGEHFFFPKKNGSGSIDPDSFRKGNSSDKNTTYLSVTFKLKADAETDIFFEEVPSFSAEGMNMRVSVTAYTEGMSKGDLYDSNGNPKYTKVYANSASTTEVVGNTNGGKSPTAVEAFSAHTKDKGKANRLFSIGANETKIVTINIWLQKNDSDNTEHHNTDFKNNMSTEISVTNFGITSFKSYYVTANAYYSTDGGSSYTAGDTGGTVKVGSADAGATSTSEVKYNASVSLVAAASNGYEFVGWYDAAAGDTKISDDSTYNYTLNTVGDKNVFARFIKLSTVTIYIAPREDWGAPDIRIWDNNKILYEHLTASYDGSTGYYKATVQTRGTWLNVVLSKDSNFTDQTSDITVVSSLSAGTDYSKFIDASDNVSDWSDTKRCLWFIISENWLVNNIKNDKDWLRVWTESGNPMRRINDKAYVCEFSSTPSGTIYFQQMYKDNNIDHRNEWSTSVPTELSQYKETSYNAGAWQ